jgi:23S rRNA (cytosine1962-C5)-methyltransferase
MKRIILKPNEEKRIRGGHPWVFDNEVDRIVEGVSHPEPAVLEPGELADVESSRKEYLGRAFANPNSKIIARIYSPSKEGVDTGFFKKRLREALERRLIRDHAAGGCSFSRESRRVVFAEADFLPGLIIDRFVGWSLQDIEGAFPANSGGNGPAAFETALDKIGPPESWVSVQFLCYGMDIRRDMILKAVEEVLNAGDIGLGLPSGFVEKSSVHVRELEGLPLTAGLIKGSFPERGIVIFENGFPFAVNLLEGQKTGHFLDQKDNRRLAAELIGGLGRNKGGADSSCPRVLDACSYTGGFGIHALRSGAASCVAVDVSAGALSAARLNAVLNGVGDKLTTIEGDIFGILARMERQKEKFDMVILDPPAFAKSRSALEGALRGYREINLRALRLLSRGGVLVSCSCSQALGETRFKQMIAASAADAGRRLIQLDFRCQAPDHPVLAGYDESFYLKCGFYLAV